jgi:hypothetical protein
MTNRPLFPGRSRSMAIASVAAIVAYLLRFAVQQEPIGLIAITVATFLLAFILLELVRCRGRYSLRLFLLVMPMLAIVMYLGVRHLKPIRDRQRTASESDKVRQRLLQQLPQLVLEDP